jgi:hypothetical protein
VTVVIEPLNRYESCIVNTAEDAFALCQGGEPPSRKSAIGHLPYEHRRGRSAPGVFDASRLGGSGSFRR